MPHQTAQDYGMSGCCVGWFDHSGVFVHVVFAEELGKGDGSFRAGLQSMLLDGSLQEVCTVLSKALYGEPLVNQLTLVMHCLKLTSLHTYIGFIMLVKVFRFF